jgi:carboxylesterase type B
LECLRQLPEAQLKAVSDTSYNAGYLLPGYDWGLFWYGPVVDGKFVQQLPDRAFKEGNFYHVPLIVDHGQYEGLDFTNQNWTTQAETVTDAMAMFQWWSPSFISRLFQLYPASDYNSSVFQREQWFGDAIVNCTVNPTYF